MTVQSIFQTLPFTEPGSIKQTKHGDFSSFNLFDKFTFLTVFDRLVKPEKMFRLLWQTASFECQSCGLRQCCLLSSVTFKWFLYFCSFVCEIGRKSYLTKWEQINFSKSLLLRSQGRGQLSLKHHRGHQMFAYIYSWTLSIAHIIKETKCSNFRGADKKI